MRIVTTVSVRVIVFSALFCGFSLFPGLYPAGRAFSGLFAAPAAAVDSDRPGDSLPGFENAISDVAQTAGKAVVSISAEHITRVPAVRRYYFGVPRGGSLDQDEMLRKFFEDYFGQVPEREFKQMGLGSGVIIDPRGYILTNQHVVDQADSLTVILSDGRKFKAEVKGEDYRSDLAIVKIDAPDLPFAPLGDSASLRIGQWVVAIGNPFGFAMQNPEPTVTAGVISALHRTLGRALARDKELSDLIQTDAAINPGNSGGPLVNLKGEIIGINVAIFSTTGGYQGVGFAIPINNAKRIIAQLIEGKKVRYGWLGVSVQELTTDLSNYFGIGERKGVLVTNILGGGPADVGGLRQGDIIVKFGGKNIGSAEELLHIVGQSEVGAQMPLTVIRDGKDLALRVTVGERPQANAGLAPKKPADRAAAAVWRGVKVEESRAEGSKKPGAREYGGVVVTGIEPGSPADNSGLIVGDTISEINKQPVESLDDYKRAVSAARGDALIGTGRGYVILKEK